MLLGAGGEDLNTGLESGYQEPTGPGGPAESGLPVGRQAAAVESFLANGGRPATNDRLSHLRSRFCPQVL